MKRITAIILTVLICLSVTACKNTETKVNSNSETALTTEISSNEESSIKTETSAKTETSVISSVVSETDNSVNSSSSTQNIENSETDNDEPQDSYENIECVSVTGYQEIRIQPTDSKSYLILKLPQEWKIEKDSQGFSIVKNSKKIGIITENFKLSGEVADETDYSYTSVASNHIINKIGEKQYNHIISYYYDTANIKKSISICVPYQELDSDAIFEMIYSTKTSLSTSKSNTGAMLLTDSRKKISILGNSFIASSQIGSILQQMCGNKVIVEAQARGYAEVSTYAQDGYLLDRIKSGEFSALFMCGFYGSDDATSFQTFVNACNSSNTKIAIFPAHNEGRQNITLAQQKFPNVLIIDWKNEIDELIVSGVQSNELYVNDSHKHSTPLAGYVGAHMIYRAIFGEMPTGKSFTEISTYQINLLGNYVNTGLSDGSIKDEYSIYKF